MVSKPSLATLAEEMLKSYSLCEQEGLSTFTIPAGVTDVEALKALNALFRENLSGFNRDAVEAGEGDWELSLSYEQAPKEFPDDFRERDYSKPREVAIIVLVPGTEGKIRDSQAELLAQRGLVFADPRDIAIAVALHACTHEGADLCKGLAVRGSWRDMVQVTRRGGLAVDTVYDEDQDDNLFVAASGSPVSEKS
ncbi:MAG: hypothetical protein RL326_2197 [Pseudomonadota bacterium]|jgi:hypothetical protein